MPDCGPQSGIFHQKKSVDIFTVSTGKTEAAHGKVDVISLTIANVHAFFIVAVCFVAAGDASTLSAAGYSIQFIVGKLVAHREIILGQFNAHFLCNLDQHILACIVQLCGKRFITGSQFKKPLHILSHSMRPSLA